jgi:cysteine desulfurase/selenocysteine lyase
MQRLGLPGTLRASFAFYNTRADADALADALDTAATMLR